MRQTPKQEFWKGKGQWDGGDLQDVEEYPDSQSRLPLLLRREEMLMGNTRSHSEY
jgi:hypothetical protein